MTEIECDLSETSSLAVKFDDLVLFMSPEVNVLASHGFCSSPGIADSGVGDEGCSGALASASACLISFRSMSVSGSGAVQVFVKVRNWCGFWGGNQAKTVQKWFPIVAGTIG